MLRLRTLSIELKVDPIQSNGLPIELAEHLIELAERSIQVADRSIQLECASVYPKARDYYFLGFTTF